jgi:hypothetical protein
MKFGMDVMPLVSTLKSYFQLPTVFRTNTAEELVRRDRQ